MKSNNNNPEPPSPLPPPPASAELQAERYRQALALHGAELARFMVGYERDEAKRQELNQEL